MVRLIDTPSTTLTRQQDPALRNPLLKLLQWRYGYKDGDFERDPQTGVWTEGEGEHVWETRPHPASGSSSRRRERNNNSASASAAPE
jgi:hypothetical protein